MTGVELFERERLIFRGAVEEFGGRYLLFDEDGNTHGADIRVSFNGGSVYDGDGNLVDPIEPGAGTIIELMRSPELTHKGSWLMWLLGIYACAVTVCSILFADELFRWNLSFSIRNADRAEPTDWEIATRYISWTVLPIMALVIFITGLKGGMARRRVQEKFTCVSRQYPLPDTVEQLYNVPRYRAWGHYIRRYV